MLDQPAKTVVPRKTNEFPVQARVMVPFVPLTEFAAHEEQLLAGMSVHPRQKHTEIGELLPLVPRHLGQQRALAVHHFIVAEHQNEILLKRVEKRERDVAVMITPVNRVDAHVFQEIVHPAHVPFESKPEPTEISRTRYAGPRGRFLSKCHDSGETLVADFVETFQEIDCVEVLAAAVNIWDPLARLSRIIEVKHRSHSVHAQPVDVILVEPEKRIPDKKIPHFIAAKIKNERAPVLLFTLARIHVFIEVRAIEFSQGVRILWKMRRHPIHDYADAGLMTFVDEVAKFVGRAEPAGGRVIICDLITPGTFKGMLRDWQQLDMRVAHLQHIWEQRFCELEITEMTISLLSFAPPRAQVHFVNTDGTSRPVARPARFHPCAIIPGVTFQIVHQRCGRFSVLIEERKRIALEKQCAGLSTDLELVVRALFDAG